jgi:organic hydroperoxide reductase OsmC/OhrA
LGKAEAQMISSQPNTIANNLYDLEQRIQAFVGAAMAAASKGLSVADFAELSISLPGLDHAEAVALVEKAHQVCPYSNATRGNVDVKLTVV